MAKGSRGNKISSGASIAQSNTPAQKTGTGAGAGGGPFGTFDDNDAQQLRDDMDDIYSDPDVTAAIKLYITDSNPNGDGYSHSQNLNYKLDNGLKLNATEKYIDDNIQAGMHDLGKNSNLVRFCHDDILQKCGIADYSKLSESQLQQKLIGTKLQTTAYMSTSYNIKNNPFAPGAPQGGGREVVMNVKAAGTTKVVFGAKKQSEIVINKGTNMRITGVHYDGTTAYPRSGGAKPRIVIDVETY